MDIHIFNPETDYALGSPAANYNPPASVIRLRREMALFPATFAAKGDAIALIDDLSESEVKSSPYHKVSREKGISIISVKALLSFLARCAANPDKRPIIRPWGWNLSLRNELLRLGVKSEWLKSETEIEHIRTLSHRRTTIPFQRELARLLPSLNIMEARELATEEEAMAFAEENPGAYFKMPWSSSGRGVVCASRMSVQKLREWTHGAISRQGSVMGEHGYDRTADFATEWVCSGGFARFAGLSWFSTSSNGNYLRNAPLSQPEIDANIRKASPSWGHDIINAQREALNSLIAPYYSGPLGIDMLADKDGRINPCVEINIRMTMGMASILSNN